MKAFVLAAGEGTRMRPLTANIPKPLLPVAGKPFLLHTLDALKANGILDITILIGWRGRRIWEYFGRGENLGLRIDYEEQEERLGTAHAVGLARGHVKGPFVCVNGDIVITPKSIKSLLDFGRKKSGTIIALAEVGNPQDFGVVEVKDERVVRIEEKPKRPRSNLINAGLYLFEEKIFEFIDKTGRSPRGEFEITDTLQLLMKEEDLYAYRLPEDWIDVGRPWDMLGANEILLKNLEGRIEGEVEERATIHGEVRIGEGTIVRNGSYIYGPTIIGKDCEIGPNCLIRPSTYVGNHCKIGNACEVKNSIIMDGTHVPHISYMGDSIIGERCNLGAGTKIANLRLDEKTVRILVKGQEVDTGRRKLGTIIGDDVKIGINASIDVGTIIGENCFIGPGAIVRGNIAPNSRVF